MVLKDLDPYTPSNKLESAGRAAEEQMAFYLRRAFGFDAHIHVLNGLRFEFEGEVAQIDHLALHRYGAVLVESKSVTSTVSINQQGEWVRVFGGKPQGMSSPILQGKRQGLLLKRLLSVHSKELLDKVFGILEGGFGYMAVDVLVAISDSGIIKRPPNDPLPEVCKADQVTDKILALLERYKHQTHPLNLNPANLKSAPRTFNEKEVARMAAFLRQQHTPLHKPAPAVELSEESFKCRHCGSKDLEALYGKFGYYLKCRQCSGNTPLKPKCPKCDQAARVRKDGTRFFAECEGCSYTALLFVNPGYTKSG